MEKHLIALSLFSGAGGMDIGVKNAGFNVLAEIEIDKFCCETLRAAAKREHSDTEIYETDVRQVEPENLVSELHINPGELDLLFGGPPCQPFSLAGKQNGLNDKRGPLLFEIIRFALCLQPKIVLLEQVKGLLNSRDPEGKRGGVFSLFLSELDKIGYKSIWRVCCAADYGVPQLRERVFLVATHGANRFSFPAPTHANCRNSPNLLGLLPYKTVGEAIAGLGKPFPKTKGITFYPEETNNHVDVTPERDRERIAHVPEGSYLAAQTHLDKSLLCNLLSKDTTKYLRLDRKKPSNTLRCGEIFYHPVENRYLTPREYMRLHGFADDYKLYGPIRSRTGTVKNLDQHRQVANSVPPPMAYVMARKIREYINEQDI